MRNDHVCENCLASPGRGLRRTWCARCDRLRKLALKRQQALALHHVAERYVRHNPPEDVVGNVLPFVRPTPVSNEVEVREAVVSTWRDA